jgi:hypothetical protein
LRGKDRIFFIDREGLSGEGGFIDPQLSHLKKPDVGRDLVSGLE